MHAIAARGLIAAVTAPSAKPATFQIGYAGLLDGRRCTTHWRYGAELAELFPEAVVDTDVLYVEDGTIVTGAKTYRAASISVRRP